MQAVQDFERGQIDYQRGLRNCPFTVQARKEAWMDGWRTGKAQSEAAYCAAHAAYRARHMNAELLADQAEGLKLKGMI
jgi:ribosome modulation factor